jgi:D-glycero-D-manno-heptose 1,7-bisphosphate phosphatase
LNKAVFLAKDGVITEVNDLHLLPWAAESIKILNDLNYKVFIVTNQDNVGLGYISEQALAEIHIKLIELLLEEADAQIDDIIYCPHKPLANCHCQLPKPAMLLELANKHNIDMRNSFTIGERGTDIVAGRLAGTRTLLIIDEDEIIPVVDVDNVVFSLKEAVAWILEITHAPEPSFS